MQRISVIVPMYNEARHITRTLDSVILAARVAAVDYELIVVDNGSTDQGPQRARELGARVLLCPGIGIGALRNRGAAVATGDCLAFLDADIEVPGNWLQLWQQTLAEQRADVFALDCAAPRCAPWFARAWQRRSLAGGQQVRQLQWMPSPNLCLPRAWFERVGGFDERLRTGEDKDFGLRLHAAGARQISLSRPQVLHWGFEGSWREWAGKERWRQGSHVQLLKSGGLNLRLLRFPLLLLACACSAWRRCWGCSPASPPAPPVICCWVRWRHWPWPCARGCASATRCLSCNSGCCTGCACTWGPWPWCRPCSTAVPGDLTVAKTLFWLCLLLPFYAWVGYPLLLALLSRLVKPRAVPEGSPLSVSVIIAAHNEGPHIEHKLRTLLQQDYPASDLQIILASDGSSDDTVATALSVRDSRIVVLDLPRVGKAGALNAAVELARNDILVFTDADNQWSDDTLGKLLAPLADPQVAPAAGT